MKDPCEQCGTIHAGCKAHRSGDPTHPCGRPPRKGSDVCPSHGGRAPQVKAKAAERRIETEIIAAAARLSQAAPVGNPLEFLLHRLGEIDAWLGIIRDKAATLADAEALTYRTENGDTARAIVTLYERALDRAVKAAAQVASLQIDERLTAITEREVAALERAVEAAWNAGRAGTDLDTARAEAGRHLTAVA